MGGGGTSSTSQEESSSSLCTFDQTKSGWADIARKLNLNPRVLRKRANRIQLKLQDNDSFLPTNGHQFVEDTDKSSGKIDSELQGEVNDILSAVDHKEFEQDIVGTSSEKDFKNGKSTCLLRGKPLKASDLDKQKRMDNKLHSSKIIKKTRKLVENDKESVKFFGPRKRGRPRKKTIFDVKHTFTNRSDTLTTKSERP